MSDQPDLLSWSPPVAARRSDPETSHEAADRRPQGRAIDRARVLEAHAEHPDGLDDFQLAELVGRGQTSAGKRRGELRDLGLICDSGLKGKHNGSTVIIWRITPAGLAYFMGRAA